jgi:branched-chain amino acid transport system ATP-binding protein
MTLLEARQVVKDYPSVKVLKKVDLSVPEGDTLAVIGPNGAGKTTLFKVLSGEVFADSGSVLFRGADVTRVPEWKRVRTGFGRSFQVARVFKDLTAAANVLVAVEAGLRNTPSTPRRLFGCDPGEAALRSVDEVLEEVGLAGKAGIEAKLLSHGDKKRLELAMSLVLRPTILLLDEPTAGMSPADRKASVELIASVKQRHGMTVVLTEHDMGVVFDLASHVAVLHHGEMIAAGKPAEVRENPLVRKIYLGSGGGHA